MAPPYDNGRHPASGALDVLTVLWHHSEMKLLLPVLVLMTLLLPGCGEAETYTATAPSNITVQVEPDGLFVHQRSVRYEVFGAIPDDIKVGVPFSLHLATITTVSDGRTDDPSKAIEVAVDALSGSAPRRVATFSDDGSEGIVSSPYFITTQSGCCSPLTRHHVRNIETGMLLFTATGHGEAGLVVVMDVPNHHPKIKRWAAYEGRPDGGNEDRALLGYLRYGDRNGAIDTIEVRMNVADQPKDFILDLPECGALRWVEPGRTPAPGQPTRQSDEKCFDPERLSDSTKLLTTEHKSGAIGGFELEISLSDKVYAAIPVEDDRIDLVHARLARGMSLVPAR